MSSGDVWFDDGLGKNARGWYHADEAGVPLGPFESPVEALESLDGYCESLGNPDWDAMDMP